MITTKCSHNGLPRRFPISLSQLEKIDSGLVQVTVALRTARIAKIMPIASGCRRINDFKQLLMKA
jgi:hypothetical protein